MTITRQGLSTVGKYVSRNTPVKLGHSSMTMLQRMQHGLDCLPPIADMTLNDSRLWGSESWTGEEVRTIIIHGISEGLTLRRVLDDLAEAYGEMPSYHRVHTWRKGIASFEMAYQAARSARGEQVADTATEIALGMTEDTVASDREKVKHLQWLATKLNRQDFGEHKTVETKDAHDNSTDDQVDKRIHAIMKRLGMESKVMEAQVVVEEPDAEEE